MKTSTAGFPVFVYTVSERLTAKHGRVNCTQLFDCKGSIIISASATFQAQNIAIPYAAKKLVRLIISLQRSSKPYVLYSINKLFLSEFKPHDSYRAGETYYWQSEEFKFYHVMAKAPASALLIPQSPPLPLFQNLNAVCQGHYEPFKKTFLYSGLPP